MVGAYLGISDGEMGHVVGFLAVEIKELLLSAALLLASVPSCHHTALPGLPSPSLVTGLTTTGYRSATALATWQLCGVSIN
jgi:hypothetical protein